MFKCVNCLQVMKLLWQYKMRFFYLILYFPLTQSIMITVQSALTELLYHYSCFRKIKIKIKQFQFFFFFLRGKESHLQLIRGSSLPHSCFSSFSNMKLVSCIHFKCFRKYRLTNQQKKTSLSFILLWHKLYFFP